MEDWEDYIGTKLVRARPMTLGGYNHYRGWDMLDDDDPKTPGYLVEYYDGGKPNHPNHDHYISWSPADVFDNAYRVTGPGLDFGEAVLALKQGQRVARQGWNGKGMFLFLVPGSQFQVNRPPLLGIYPEGTTIDYQPHIDMKTAQGTVVPWLASQSDVLAHDWEVVQG